MSYTRTRHRMVPRAKRLYFILVGGVLGIAALMVSAFGISSANAQVVTDCTGVEIVPGDDLALVAAANAPGTTYCINDGSYSVTEPIVVQEADSFIGVYPDSTRPAIATTTAQHIFFYAAGQRDALISGLDVSGARGGDYCEPNCGRGIGGPGLDLTVKNVRSHHNQNQGIGGTGSGLVIRGSELDHNGSRKFTAADDGEGEPSSAAGVKSVNSFTITGSYVHDNWWNGIWCDSYRSDLPVQYETYFYAYNNVVKDNGKIGISDEICTTARIGNNRIIHNGHNPAGSTVHAGILVNGSRDARVFGNTVRRNKVYGIKLSKGGTRSSSFKVSVVDNVISRNQVNISGCSLVEVTCKRNSS